VLADAEYDGVRLDVANRECQLRTTILELISNIHHTPASFNINSTQQLANVLFNKLGLPPFRKTKTSSRPMSAFETSGTTSRRPS
jgi:DNA polymerase-1